MTTRIQIVVDEGEKERFRRGAEREGKTLSGWLRDLARERLEAQEERRRLDTVEELRAFFAASDEREGDAREPDWEEHRRVIDASIRSGEADA